MTPTQYIWEKEIVSISQLGEWLNEVTFKDETTEIFNDKQLEYFITEEQKDATQFNEIVIKQILNDVIEVFKDADPNDLTDIAAKILMAYEAHDIKMSQVDTVWIRFLWLMREIIQTVADSYMVWYKLAVWKAFWTYQEWLHHDYFIDNIKVSDIKRLKD